jgi:hypothetical protein
MLQKSHIIQQTGMLVKLSTCLRVAASAKAGRPPFYVEDGNPQHITKTTFCENACHP